MHTTNFPSGEVRGQLHEVDDGDDSILTLVAALTPEDDPVMVG